LVEPLTPFRRAGAREEGGRIGQIEMVGCNRGTILASIYRVGTT